MREVREQQRRAKEDEERRLDSNFAEQEAQAKKAGKWLIFVTFFFLTLQVIQCLFHNLEMEQREAAERARRQSKQETMLEKTASILGKLESQGKSG